MAIIGIDLGTTNSLVSVWKNNQLTLIPNIFGKVLTPSVVSFDEDNTLYVGKVATERLISRPDCSITSFKRFMGTDQKFKLQGKKFSPEELSSFVLRQLKEDAERYLGEPIEEAVGDCRGKEKLFFFQCLQKKTLQNMYNYDIIME